MDDTQTQNQTAGPDVDVFSSSNASYGYTADTTQLPPTSYELADLYQSLLPFITAQVSRYGGSSGVDITSYLSSWVASGVAEIGSKLALDSEIQRDLQVYALRHAQEDFVGDQTEDPKYTLPTMVQNLSGGDENLAGAATYVALSYAGTGNTDINAAVVNATDPTNSAAVVTTAMEMTAGMTNEEERREAAAHLTPIALALLSAVNQPGITTDSLQATLSSGILGAANKLESGSVKDALLSMHKSVQDGEFNDFSDKLAQSRIGASGLSELMDDSLEKFAGKQELKGNPEGARLTRSTIGTARTIGKYREKGALEELGSNLVKLGPVMGAAALIGAALGDPNSMAQLVEGNVKAGAQNERMSRAFNKWLSKKMTGMNFGGNAWERMLMKQFGLKTGENTVMATAGRNVQWGAGLVTAKNTKLAKAMKAFAGAHPAMFISGGAFATKSYDRELTASRMKRRGKGKGQIKNSVGGIMGGPLYQGFVRSFQMSKTIGQKPFFMLGDGLGRVGKYLNNRFSSKDGKPSDYTKFKRSVATSAIWGLVTGGTVTLATFAWAGLNFVTGGIPDKIVWGTVKWGFGIVVVVAVVLTLLFTNFLGTFTGGNFEYIQLQGLSSGALLVPNADYKPILVQRITPTPGGGGGGVNCVNGVKVEPKTRIEPKFSARSVSVNQYQGRTGIDVSHWNGSITWPVVAKDPQGIKFAYMKATEGTSYFSEYIKQFKGWWKESKNANVPRSAYHFFRPDEDGYSQANYFMNTIYDAGGGDFGEFQVAIDVEMTSYLNLSCGLGVSTDNLKAFLDQVEAMLGYKAVIYTSDSQWQQLTTQPSWAGDYPLWVAAWNNGSGPGKLPSGWSDYLIWQYSDSGKVNGITSGAVDMNKWNR